MDHACAARAEATPGEIRLEAFGDHDDRIAFGIHSGFQPVVWRSPGPRPKSRTLSQDFAESEAVEVLHPMDEGYLFQPAPAEELALGVYGRVGGDDEIGREGREAIRDGCSVGPVGQEPPPKGVFGERRGEADRGDRERGRIVRTWVKSALRPGQIREVQVLNLVAAPGEFAAQLDLERMAGEIVNQNAHVVAVLCVLIARSCYKERYCARTRRWRTHSSPMSRLEPD